MNNKNDLYICRVCGFPQDTQDPPPWGLDGKSPSYEICGCCGVEFGFNDCTLQDIKNFRRQWLEQGALWRFPEEKPDNWSLDEQLKNIPLEYK